MSRQHLLLSIVAGLVLLQFVVLPAFEYLDADNEAIQAQNLKAQKEKALLAMRVPLEEQMDKVNSFLAELHPHSLEVQTHQSGKLEVQKLFEGIAAQHNVKINRINWVEPEPNVTEKFIIQINVKSTPADWVLMQGKVEASKWLNLQKMSFYFPLRSGDKRLTGSLSGLLAYEVNFRLKSDANN